MRTAIALACACYMHNAEQLPGFIVAVLTGAIALAFLQDIKELLK